jgi:RNA polymerase sigma-70 factor (family 1)
LGQAELNSNSELYNRIRAGDAEAFAALYKLHYRELYIAAFNRLKDQEICKDIVHDVFLSLWQKAANTNIARLEAYLHTAVRYQVIKQLTKKPTHPFYNHIDEMAAAPGMASDNLAYKDIQQLVELWIETLPPKRKEIFLLHYRDQLSTKEIAQRLHLSQKSVQNQLGIAFNDLRDKLPFIAFLFLSAQA